MRREHRRAVRSLGRAAPRGAVAGDQGRAAGLQLVVGDKLQIPELTTKTFTLETGKLHELVVYVPTVVVGFPLIRRDGSGEPYANCPYELRVPGIDKVYAGVTEDDGYLEQRLPADVEVVEVRVRDNLIGVARGEDEGGGGDEEGGEEGGEDEGDEGEHAHHDQVDAPEEGWDRIPIYLGHLPPVDTDQGVQARLINLGYACPMDGDLSTPESKAAVGEFQDDQKITPEGERGVVDDATRAALATLYDGEDEGGEGEGGEGDEG